MTPAKLRYLVQKKQRGWSASRIAADIGMTKRRVNQIWKAWQADPDGFHLKPPGRKRKAMTTEELVAIMDAWTKFRVSAVPLEAILRLGGTRINHNRIHQALLGLQVAREEPKKKRRRKWVRYERPHSNDLWHADWTQLPDGRWLILIEDDASRLVTGWGIHPSCTAEPTIQVLDHAVETWGRPRQLLTDKGAHFYANEQEGKKKGISQFTERLTELGIQHITSRTNHPQTNGKNEKLGGTVKRAARTHFDNDFAYTIHWYNEIRPHMSLRLNRAETPMQAYWRKLPVEAVFERTGDWFWS